MTLGTISKGPSPSPDRILLYGVEGVGKSSWGASAPSSIFLPTEAGIGHLSVERFQAPKAYPDVLDAVATLENVEHGYKTLVVDTMDALEPLIADDVCARNGWDNPESPGYGRGWVAIASEWRKFLLALDRLRSAKAMEIILIAHSTLRNITNPAGPDYCRYESKINKLAAALVREWADSCLFATYEDFIGKGKGELRAKVQSSGRRIIHTQRGAGWDAKSRHNLPPVLALDYAEYAAAREAGRPASPEKLVAEARELLDAWAPDAPTRARAEAKIEAQKADAAALAKIVDYLRTKATEKENA